MNDHELTALLEQAIPPGPEGPALSTVLRAGSQAVRRRRLAVGSTVTAVALVGAGAAAALGSGSTGTGPGPATDPTSAAPPSGPPLATGDTVSLDDFLGSDMLVELRSGGLLRVRPGVEVLEWVDNPIGRTPPDHSMGLVLRYEGEVTWHLLDLDTHEDGWASSGGASSSPGAETGTFDAWLAEQVRLAQLPQPHPDEMDSPLDLEPGKPLVELQPDGSLDLLPGVEVLDRIDNPAGHALPSRSVAVAFTYEGRERWAVLQILVDDTARVTGGGANVTYADEAQEDSLEEYAAANDGKVYHP